MGNNALYEKLKEIMEHFVSDSFNVLQLSNISDEVLFLPLNIKEEMVSFFQNSENDKNTAQKILFNPKEEEMVSFFQKQVNINDNKSEKKIMFNSEQTEQLLSALKKQAKEKGFVQHFFNRKLQSKIDTVIKNLNDTELIEMELVKKDENFSFNVAVYNEDNFDSVENMSLKEKKKFENKCMIEIPLNIFAKEYIEKINENFELLVNLLENLCQMLYNIDFGSQDIIENEIGYIDEKNNKNIAGYVVKTENKTNIILFNNLLQQFDYETNIAGRNRVLEIITEKEVKAGTIDNFASQFIEMGFFSQQQYSEMYQSLFNSAKEEKEEQSDIFFENLI